MPRINGEFVPKAKLAQSNFHHEVMGSSDRNHPVTPENLHRPSHEFLSDEALCERVADDIEQVRREHALLGSEPVNTSGMKRSALILIMRDKFLFPNLRYLEAIERLPEGVDIAVLKVELALPDETK